MRRRLADRDARKTTRQDTSDRIAITVAAAALVLIAAPAAGQTGVIAGRVTQEPSGTPLLGVTIVLPGTERGALVDSLGRFTIVGLAPRSYLVQARRQGYETLQRLAVVRPGETTLVSFALTPSAQVLGGIRTEARAADHDLFLARPAVGTTSITARSVEAVPRLGEPDIIRVVQLLPGVAAKNDFSTGFNVRGGEADQNLVLIDGYPIYNPFHLGGLFSTFMDATVRDVTLMTGAFPARYGGRLSSVLDVRSATEARPGLHGSAEVSLLGGTGALGGQMGNSGSWLVAARRTYADKVVDRFSSEVLPYHFRDMHAHVATLLPGGIRFGFTGYGGDDVLNADLAEVQDDSTAASAGEGTFLFRWGNSVVGTTFSRSVPLVLGADSIAVEQRFSRSRFSTDVNAGEGSATLRNTVNDLRAGGVITHYTRAHEFAVGYEVSRLRTATVDGSPQAQVAGADLRQTESGYSLFADDLWKPTPESRWLVQGGLRFERFGSGGWQSLSPRLSVKYFVRPDLAVTLAGGRFAQWVHSLALEDSPIRLFDFWLASDSQTPVATATHAVAGIERWFSGSRQLRIEGFYKQYGRLLEANLTDDPFVVGDEFVPMLGRAYGFDLLLRQFETADRRVSGWLSYNYSVALREQDDVRYFPGHDRRHSLNAVATWRSGKYLFGARLGIAGGTPYTEMIGQYVRRAFDPSTNTWEFPGAPPHDVTSVGGPRNGARYPFTQRLDLNVSRDYQRGRATIRPYLSVVNAYNAKNVFIYILDYGEVPPIRRTISQFPIVPSLGVSVVF